MMQPDFTRVAIYVRPGPTDMRKQANGLNPYGYLHYGFSRLPEVETSGDWDSLLPQNLAAEDINDPAFAGVGRN